MSICPCPCFNFLNCCFEGRARKQQKAANNQAEEQNLMSFKEEHTLVDTISQPKPIFRKSHQKVEINSLFEEDQEGSLQSDLLDVKMELTPSPASSIAPVRDIEDLIKQQLGIALDHPVAEEPPAKVEEKKEEDFDQFEVMFDEISQQTFTINLDPLDPFFPILHERTAKIDELFNKKGAPLEISQPNKANLDITAINNGRMSTFIMKYTLDCSFSYYLSLLKNERLLASLSPVIGQMKVLEAFRPNLTRNIIKFKRLGGFQPRDCCYIKYQNSSKRQHWEVYIHDDKSQPIPSSTTCELFCVKNIRETGQKELSIKQYIEIDLQTTNTANILPKLATQYRNHLNNLQTHLESNYEQESA